MIRNYFKIAFANLIKSKVYSTVSISSMTVGFAVCIILLLYVSHELSYDRYHDKADNIYRLCQEKHPYQAPVAAKLLEDNLPEIKNSARILPRDNIIVQLKDQRFKETDVAWADATLFEIFSFKFTKGNAQTSLQNPGTCVVTEKIAHKYFGNENPIGKMLKVNNKYNYTIASVIEDIPENSHFKYDIFLTLEDGDMIYGSDWMNHWGWENFLVYFEMQDGFSKPDLETKISQIIAKRQGTNPDSPLPQYTIQPLKKIHLYSAHFLGDIQPQSSITYVLIFLAIGLLILLIACFNYINLLTANATTRITEIGIRKAFGASRKQLAAQFISESFVVLFVSLSLSFVLVKSCLPIFNEITGKALSFTSLINGNTIAGIIGLVIFVAVLAGWYPAFILSSYNPTKVLKASKNRGSSKFEFKKILVGAQFTIVIALISCAIIMFRQINYLKQKDLGFDKEAVLISAVNFGDEEKYNTLKQALLRKSYVSSVSSASRVPSGTLGNIGSVLPEGQTKRITIPFVHVNYDYFKTLDIKATQGRLFSNKFKADATESIILNQASVKRLRIEGNPIGQSIRCSWPKSDRKIVGIINDIHFESLYNKIKPVVFVICHDECDKLMVKLKPSVATSSIHSLTKTCQEIYPDEIFDFHFLDIKLEQLYLKDKKTFQLMGYFALLAIILACMGLLGMASFVLKRRTKEIGIRRVNGATVSEIMQLLNVYFVKWVALAFIIAFPIAYYGMNKWLENFAFKTELSWWVFALAGFITLLIVLITISWQTFREANKNPIESLRYE